MTVAWRTPIRNVRQPDAARDGFRPDLEGLRAIAVMLVVLYHAGAPGFTGGYVGVDVFFVLSGFLITGLLLREASRTGTIGLVGFYARRARRLLPAAALVLAVTLLVSAVVLPPLAVPDVTRDVGSAALYVSNIRFAGEATDYLQSELAPSPVLHYWSLSLEEQFYLLWPAIVFLAVRRGGDVQRRVLLIAALVVVGSVTLSIWLTQTNQPWAFFSLPTRAWELGLGALIVVALPWIRRIPAFVGGAAAWAGLAAVALAGIAFTTSTPFPGTAAILPTVGAALVIAGGSHGHAWGPGRWLGTAVPRFLGRISYSLYLWHWPLLILPAAALGSLADPAPVRVGLVVAAVVLAAATQRWVEEPLRHGRWIGTTPRQNLALAGALSVVLVVSSLGVAGRAEAALGAPSASSPSADDASRLEAALPHIDVFEAPTRSSAGTAAPDPDVEVPWIRPRTLAAPVPPGLRPSLATARDDNPQPQEDGCAGDRGTTKADGCTYGGSADSPTMVLLGDSHALAWFPTLEQIAVDRGWRLISITKAACQVADIVQWDNTLGRAYSECAEWRRAVIERMDRLRPDLVVVTNSRGFTLASSDGSGPIRPDDQPVQWQEGMARTLKELVPSAGQVVVLADTPAATVNVPECVSGHKANILDCSTPVTEAIMPAWVDAARAAADAGGAAFIDPAPWVCPSDPCPPIVADLLVYRDRSHMTATFAAALSARLKETLSSIE